MHLELTTVETLIFSVFYCIFMLGLSIIFLKFPPKSINALYGYRTVRSMKNQDTWDASNNYWIKLNVKLNIACFIVPVVTYFVNPSLSLVATIIASVVSLIIIIICTEKHLKNHFDKNGNRI